MELALAGQVALVTGGTRGIGRAIVAKLARAGAQVVLTSRSADNASVAAHELSEETEGLIEGFACDVGDAKACEGLVGDIIQRHGRIDILVNNAGITNDKLIMRMSDRDWRSIFDTNLHGAFYTVKAVTRPMMKQRSGRIINISSVVGLHGNPGQANYAATKAGLIGLTKSVARELGSRGITANVVAPGYIQSDMTDAIDEKMKDALLGQIPLGSLGEPDDVAEVVLFLASPAARYITGAVLQVDGGLGM